MIPQKAELQQWFEAEVAAHEPSLRFYLAGKLPPGVDVEDVLQEIYLRLVKIVQAEPVGNVRGLVFTIARRVLIDAYREKYAREKVFFRNLDEIFDLGDDSAGSTAIRSQDEIALLRDAIGRLPAKCRTIFIMRNIEGHSYRAIAEKLGISEKTVEAQLAIGLNKCRSFLSSQGLP